MRVHRFGKFELNADLLVLTYAGEQLALGPKVVETLLALVECGCETVSKDAMLSRVWPDGFVAEANLAQNIYVLRKTFEKRGVARIIETVPGKGYRLILPFQQVVLTTTKEAASRSAARVAVAALALASCAAIALIAFGSPHAQQRTTSPSGRFYQIGRYYWSTRTAQGVRTSIAYFSHAVDANPSDARAYAGLADANVTMGDYCYGTHAPSVYFARAQAYAAQALALDAHSAEVHASLGFIALHLNRRADALRHLRLAIDLNESYASAHEWYGIALLQGGNWAAGNRELQIGARLDPLSVATVSWLSSSAYMQHRYGDAIRYARMALELSPQRMDALALLGNAYAARGDMDEAAKAFARYAAVAPYYRAEAAALLARADALAHRTQEARVVFAYALAHANSVKDADLIAAAQALRQREVVQTIVSRRSGHRSWVAVENAALFAMTHPS